MVWASLSSTSHRSHRSRGTLSIQNYFYGVAEHIIRLKEATGIREYCS